MDNILEILVPLIFAAIYFFGNIMSGKSKDEKELPPRRQADDGDAEAAERQRRIQDEIRRKIMERRRASEGGQAPPVPAGQEPGERRRPAEARREMREQTREVAQDRRVMPPPITSADSRRDEASTPPAFSWDESDNAYEGSTMQAQLRQIEETKRRAEKLKKQAAEKSKIFDEPSSSKRRSGGYFTGSVRESLQDPAAARVAFIYGEVLGQPISLRKGNSSVPGLN